MVPKYCYKVIVTSRLGERLQQQSHNYETLPGAMACREVALRKAAVTRVEVAMILDETVQERRERTGRKPLGERGLTRATRSLSSVPNPVPNCTQYLAFWA
jgi:hypothetical protein